MRPICIQLCLLLRSVFPLSPVGLVSTGAFLCTEFTCIIINTITTLPQHREAFSRDTTAPTTTTTTTTTTCWCNCLKCWGSVSWLVSRLKTFTNRETSVINNITNHSTHHNNTGLQQCLLLSPVIL